MGQIFDRISRIVKSGKSKSDDDYNYDAGNLRYLDEEDELKSIIDGLNNNTNNTNNSNQNSQNYNYNSNGIDINKACSVLKINTNSSVDEIKSAYKDRIKEYHPDKVAGLGEDIQRIAQIKTQEINEAYSLLKKFKNF